MADRTCTVDGCDRTHYAKGLCQMHYARARKTGDPGEAGARTSPRLHGKSNRPCKVEGCPRKVDSYDFCAMHYTRWRRHGDPLFERSIGRPRVAGFVSYESAHRRIVTVKGFAREYPCVECGCQAKDWAYTGNDPAEMSGVRVIRGRAIAAVWSGNPEFYQPMCRPCHKRYDFARRKAS